MIQTQLGDCLAFTHQMMYIIRFSLRLLLLLCCLLNLTEGHCIWRIPKQIDINNFIMYLELYTPSPKERLNPQFAGIAQKLNSSKLKRVEIEDERDNFLRTLKYKMSLDLSLEKNIGDKNSKLKEVKQTHHRREAEQQFKRELNELKQSRLRCLSSSIKERKEEARTNLKKGQLFTFNRNRQSQMKERRCHEQIQARLKHSSESCQLKNRRRFRSVKMGEKQSQDSVNRFYRTVNKESLNSYQNWISEQNTRASHYAEQIKMMETAISRFDGDIEKKKDRLINIFSEIEGYTSESTAEQSKCLPAHPLRFDTFQPAQRYFAKRVEIRFRQKDQQLYHLRPAKCQVNYL